MRKLNGDENTLIKYYQNEQKSSNIFLQTHFEIVYKVDQMMNSHIKIKNLKDLFSDLVSFSRFSLTTDVQKVLDGLTKKLEDKAGKRSSPIVVNDTDRKHKDELVDIIVLDLLERAYATFYEDISILIVKFIGSKLFDRATKASIKRNKKRKQKFNQVTNDAIRSLKESSEDFEMNKPAEDDKNEILSLLSKFKKIKATTVNVVTFNKLAQYDLTLDETEMEAIAEIVNLKLVMNFEGVILTFGASENLFEIPGSFSNYDKLKLEVTCKEIHRILKPFLSNLSLENFRKEISKKITTSSSTKEMIQNPHQKLVKNLGFRGGEFFFPKICNCSSFFL